MQSLTLQAQKSTLAQALQDIGPDPETASACPVSFFFDRVASQLVLGNCKTGQQASVTALGDWTSLVTTVEYRVLEQASKAAPGDTVSFHLVDGAVVIPTAHGHFSLQQQSPQGAHATVATKPAVDLPDKPPPDPDIGCEPCILDTSPEDEFREGCRYLYGDGVTQDWGQAAHWLGLAAEHGHASAQYEMGQLRESGSGVPQDYCDAARWYRLAADQGRADARYKLGALTQTGQGVRRDTAEATRLFRLAAEQGHTRAQLSLGLIYKFDLGPERSESEALHWFKMAAAQQHPVAETLVGDAYRFGTGIAADDAKAARWYEKAATRGSRHAQFMLGNLYELGAGVQRDLAAAVQWYRLAAEQGDGEAQNNLGWAFERGRGIERDLAVAAHWYRLSAEQGVATAQANLARLYDTGCGVEMDCSAAAHWYRKAAEQGNVAAQNALGYKYSKGLGVIYSYAEAAHWYRLASEQGHIDATASLGFLYLHGSGVDKDLAEAEKLLRTAQAAYLEAAEQGDAESQYRLANLYLDAVVIPGDEREASRWYLAAANQGYTPAQHRLGECYEYGRGVPMDRTEALRWFFLAADQGYAPARNAVKYWRWEKRDAAAIASLQRSAETGDAVAQFKLAEIYWSGRDVPADNTQAAYWYRLAALQGDDAAADQLGFMCTNGLGVPQDPVEAAGWFRLALSLGRQHAQYRLKALEERFPGSTTARDTPEPLPLPPGMAISDVRSAAAPECDRNVEAVSSASLPDIAALVRSGEFAVALWHLEQFDQTSDHLTTPEKKAFDRLCRIAAKVQSEGLNKLSPKDSLFLEELAQHAISSAVTAVVHSEEPPGSMGVYCIRNRATGQLYVGSTVNISARWRNHRSALQDSRHPSERLQADWKKAGEAGFEISVLEIIADAALLASAEEAWIRRLRATEQPNYNLTAWSTRPDAWEIPVLAAYRTLISAIPVERPAPSTAKPPAGRWRRLLSIWSRGFVPTGSEPKPKTTPVNSDQWRDREVRVFTALVAQVRAGELACPVAAESDDLLVSILRKAVRDATERDTVRVRAENRRVGKPGADSRRASTSSPSRS